MSASIPRPIFHSIEAFTGNRITGFSFSAGGCINHGGNLKTDAGGYFLKWNEAKKFPAMFAVEAKGLDLLRRANCIRVPEVVHVGEAEGFQFLLMEYIESSRRALSFWQNFGAGLARLHRHSSPRFGLDHDNYIGSLPQRNELAPSWVDFFVQHRLNVQLKIARENNRIEPATVGKFEMLFKRLPSLLPAEAPALLHGDLWSGNLMTDASGQPCLIDPAVYYGHREADLAMTQLFGGFADLFLQSYNDEFPLEAGYEKRVDIFNLYPLLVHVNLFGGAYLSQVMSVLDRFV